MNNDDFCLAYECPLQEVPDDMLQVCSDLGCSCDSCDHRCPGSWAPLY